MMKDKRVLLSLLICLIIIKFLIAPLFEWQNELLSERAALNIKTHKASRHIENIPELKVKELALKQSISELESNIDQYNDLGRYKIAKQRQIEGFFETYKVNINALSWREPIKSSGYSIIELNVQFKGDVKQFIELSLAIQSLSNSVQMNVFSLNILGQSKSSLGKMTGSINIQFRPMEKNNASF